MTDTFIQLILSNSNESSLTKVLRLYLENNYATELLVFVE